MLAAALAILAQSEWVDRLGDRDPEVREAASRALRDAGDAAVPALLEAATSADPEVRGRARDLIDLASARVRARSLTLALEDVAACGPGRARAVLVVTNTAAVPVWLWRPGLSAGIQPDAPAADEFVRVDPGGSLRVAFEGLVQGPNLHPVYACSRRRFASLPGPGDVRAIVVEGETGGPAVPSPTGPRTYFGPAVRIYRLRNAEPATMASLLKDVLGSRPDFEVAVDARTGSVLVKGAADDLEIVEPIITELDRDP